MHRHQIKSLSAGSMLFKLNKVKAREALLFVSNRLESADKHKLSKILYYADKDHLQKYGRMITGDHYVKMKYGPVPSYVYDLIKENNRTQSDFEVDGFNIRPLRKADTNELSESDIKCLMNSIEQHGNKTFEELTLESHDATYEQGSLNEKFDEDQFLSTFPNKDEIVEFLKTQY